MSGRFVITTLAIVAIGTIALVAADPGAIRTSITSSPAPAAPVAVAKVVAPATAARGAVQNNQIWSALVLATNDPNPKPAPPELREFAPRMKRVFGYNQFELAGSALQDIGDQNENWLVPSKSFWMGIKARRALSKEAQGGFLLSLQLFQDQRPIVDTEVKLAPGSPLFIRGPQYGKGQLIIVLQVQK
jgi:hypothetical protein